jgi:hypothetical protein
MHQPDCTLAVWLAIFVVLTLVGVGFAIAFFVMLSERTEERKGAEKTRREQEAKATQAREEMEKTRRQQEAEAGRMFEEVERREKERREQEDRDPARRRRRLEKELTTLQIDSSHLQEQIEEAKREELAFLSKEEVFHENDIVRSEEDRGTPPARR